MLASWLLWVSEWVSEWVIDWVSEWVNEWVSVSVWVREWMSEWMSEWVRERASKRVSEWLKWMTEPMSDRWTDWADSWHKPKLTFFRDPLILTRLIYSNRAVGKSRSICNTYTTVRVWYRSYYTSTRRKLSTNVNNYDIIQVNMV